MHDLFEGKLTNELRCLTCETVCVCIHTGLLTVLMCNVRLSEECGHSFYPPPR